MISRLDCFQALGIKRYTLDESTRRLHNMTEQTATPPKTAACIACRSALNPGAVLCHVCSSYQRRWRNELSYMARVVGFFTVAAGALVFLVGQLPLARRALFWKDEVALLGFKSSEYINLANVGDGPVYVSHVEVEFRDGRLTQRMTRHIGQTIAASEIKSVNLIVEGAPRERRLVLNVPDAAWNEVLGEVAKSVAEGSRRFEIIAFASADPVLMGFQSTAAGSLRTIPGSGTLHGYSPQQRRSLTQAFKVVGVIAERAQSPNQ